MTRKKHTARAAAKTPIPKRTRRAAERRRADLETPLASGAAVEVLNALAPERPVRAEPDHQGDVLDLDAAMGKGAASRPLSATTKNIEAMSVEQLLLYVATGSEGQYGFTVLESLACKQATELEALATLSTWAEDAEALSPLLMHAEQRARVIAELIRRAHV